MAGHWPHPGRLRTARLRYQEKQFASQLLDQFQETRGRKVAEAPGPQERQEGFAPKGAFDSISHF